MDALHKLEELFAHFPGIGPRQARRFTYYLLSKSPSFIKEFTSLIEEVKRSTNECPHCHRLYTNSHNKPESSICSICNDPHRDRSTLMIVARDSDFETIEKSGVYTGLYFILGGTVPILDKEPDKRIRLEKLLHRIAEISSGDLTEIILSLNTTPDGEHTSNIVREALSGFIKDKNIKISLLGRGLSTGSELEYVDGETIRNALKNRA